MKNLLIYYNPQKKFEPEYEALTKIQIDNSLKLGWNYKDIILVTNFEYNYRGIKAIVIGEGDYEVFDQNKSSKIPIINRLFADGLIEDELYWFHDVDAFQLIPFEVNLDKDAGFTDHGAYSKTWNAGSFFFKKSARDIFETIWEYMKKRGKNEQDALTFMWGKNIDGINNRFEFMGPAYNIGIYRIDENIKIAGTPKVVHFHPHKKRHLNLFRAMLPERLMDIFNKYDIR